MTDERRIVTILFAAEGREHQDMGLIVFGGFLTVLVVWGVLSRVNASQDLKKSLADNATPSVELVAAKADKAPRELTLPADVRQALNVKEGVLKRASPKRACS